MDESKVAKKSDEKPFVATRRRRRCFCIETKAFMIANCVIIAFNFIVLR